MRLLLTLILGSAVVMSPAAASASPCVCEPGPRCGTLSAASPVFIGVVQARWEAPDAEGWVYQRIGSVEHFTGAGDREVEVRTRKDCGYTFEVGESYLVHANRDADGHYVVSGCSGTRELDEEDNELRWLRQNPSDPVVNQVYGRVGRGQIALGEHVAGPWREPQFDPIAGLSVVARHGMLEYRTTTDEAGDFVFENLPPGSYTVEPQWHPGFKSRFPADPVEVSPCGAVDAVSFWAVSDAPLGGTLLTVDGKPLGENVAVTVIRVDSTTAGATDHRARSARAFPDASGRWFFDGLPPGRYLVGVNLLDKPTPGSPYSKIYYPSVADESEATPVQVVDGEQLVVDLFVGSSLPARTIAGVVVDTYGAPVGDAVVQLLDIERPDSLQHVDVTVSDADGRFELPVIEGGIHVVRVPELLGRMITDNPRIVPGDVAILQRTGDVTGLRLIGAPAPPLPARSSNNPPVYQCSLMRGGRR